MSTHIPERGHRQLRTLITQMKVYIEVLHEIVSIAQEKLDDPNGARSLPAAALFKAYDEVLPKHGIDPDDENHLSRLIFRIGGEKGSGSLPEKFQVVLASMGIALEYGDSSPISQRASRSSRSSSDDPNHLGIECLKPSSASKRLHGNLGELSTPWPSATEHELESIETESKPAARYSPSTSIPLPNLSSYPSFESVLSGPSQPQGTQQSLQWPTILENDIGKEVNCSTWGCFPVPSSLRHACGSSRYSYTVDREATGNVEHIGKYHALFQRSRRAVCDLLQVQR
ncbi:hypothetical protein NHJ13051_009647 [Beauveria bassiana]